MSRTSAELKFTEPPRELAVTHDITDVFVFPASFSQRRLWILDQLISDRWAYNLTSAYRIRGALHVASLTETFSEILRRHEILRTTFRAVDGEPVQVISEPGTFSMPLINLCALNAEERDRELLRVIDNELSHVFDLQRGPLLRVTLVKLADGEHVLIKNIHHIITDAWSEEIFMTEWTSLYESFAQNQPSRLAPLPIQYADFSEWQRGALQGGELERQLVYWKKQLGLPLPALCIPTDHPGLESTEYSGGTVPIRLSKSLTQGLKALSVRGNVTLFITLLTAFKILLHRYTNQAGIAVGTPVTNRSRVELENLIGFFLNTLVLRTSFESSHTFSEALRLVRDAALGAFEHQEVPFEILVEKLQPERNVTRHPLFQVMFMLLKTKDESWTTDCVTIDHLEIPQKSAKLDLSLAMCDKGEIIDGSFIYRSELFDQETMERMVQHLQTLLEGIVADPEKPFEELSILTESERHQLLIEWNDTGRPCSLTPVHELVVTQCTQTPEAAAIIFEGVTTTYGELYRQSLHLAAHLQNLGVARGTVVGVCVERSPGMIVSLIAILLAGGSYVPLDPDFPAARLESMISTATPDVIICQRSTVVALPENGAHLLYLEDDRPAGDQFRATQVAPDDVAYILFTSGSTGQPKGVEIPHRALTNLLESMRERPGLTSRDVLLAVTTLSFDIAGLEIFLPLICGAKIVVAGRVAASDPRQVAGLLKKHEITVMQATPATWRGLLAVGWEGSPNLKILCGGEAMTESLADQLLPRCASLWNMYGPTETTIWSTVERIERVGDPVTLGRPIANTRIYILNEGLQPQPVGIAGELYIGGLGVARGYLGRPDLTKQKFVSDPFGNPEGRLYKTGDLARYRRDGSIEYLGRIDQQVKVRGYRIEIAEIESRLGRHPDVRQCVVVAAPEQSGENRLVAYLVMNKEVGQTELRTFLKGELPDYMIPSGFVFLEALPLTPNGKIDRKALPAFEHSRLRNDEFVAARTSLEQRLAEIWAHVLGMEQVSIRDNFFELGGHSLMAVTLFTEIERKLNRKLPLATLFQAPTIEQLAGVIGQDNWTEPWSPLVAIQSAGTNEPFFCIHGADGAVLFYKKLAGLLAPQQPVYGLQAQGLDGGEIRYSSIETMADFYIKEIRTVQPKGPYFLGGYSFGGLLALEMARQLQVQGEKSALVALFDTNNPGTPPRRFTLSERIALRTRAIAGLGLKQKLTYILGRGISKVAVVLLVKREFFQRAAYRYFRKHQEVVPCNYRILHVREANNAAMRRYRPARYTGRITLIRAENPNDGFEFDSELGWGGMAEEGVEIFDVPGEHETIFQEPHVQVLARTLKSCIDQARKRCGI